VNFPFNRHEYTGDDERNQRPSGALSLPITSHLAEWLPASHFPSALRETLRLSVRLGPHTLTKASVSLIVGGALHGRSLLHDRQEGTKPCYCRKWWEVRCHLMDT